MRGQEVVEAEDVAYGVLHVVVRTCAGVALVALHQSGPLAVAHGAGARVGQKVDEDLVAAEVEQVVTCVADPLLALLASALMDRFDHFDTE